MARQNKSNELAEILRHRIISGELRASEQLESFSKLTERYNTTMATVSKALGILEQSGYVERFPGKGVFVKEKKSCRIALVLDSGAFVHDSASVSFLPILLSELEKRSQKENWTYELFLSVDSRLSAQNFLLKLSQNAFDVVLIGSFWLARNSSAVFKDHPVLAIGIYAYKDLELSISFDSYRMIYDAVLELDRQGCRQIALVENNGDKSWAKSPNCDTKAYHDALKSVGHLRDPRLHFKIPLSQQGGYDAFCELTGSITDRPLGIISVDSLITLGMVQAALFNGLNFSEDIIIATQANQGCSIAQIAMPVIMFENSLTIYLEHIARYIKLYTQGKQIPPDIDLIAPEKKVPSNNRTYLANSVL